MWRVKKARIATGATTPNLMPLMIARFEYKEQIATILADCLDAVPASRPWEVRDQGDVDRIATANKSACFILLCARQSIPDQDAILPP